MNPEKLKIVPRSPSTIGEITVLFNPNSYSLEKSVSWAPLQEGEERRVNAPTLTFGGGGGRQLTVELFFDVTESDRRRDVRDEIKPVIELTHIMRDKQHPHPPVCDIYWGNKPIGADFAFAGVVSRLTQRFTLFRSTGEPVRAFVTVIFQEYLDPEVDQRQTDPELTTRVVRRGDTLSSITAESYRDPTRWRIIAEANGLDDPRRLEIGRVLTIPKVS